MPGMRMWEKGQKGALSSPSGKAAFRQDAGPQEPLEEGLGLAWNRRRAGRGTAAAWVQNCLCLFLFQGIFWDLLDERGHFF